MATKRFELMPIVDRFKKPKTEHGNFSTSILREARPGTSMKPGGVGVWGLPTAFIQKHWVPNKIKPKKADGRHTARAAKIRWLFEVAKWDLKTISERSGVSYRSVYGVINESKATLVIKPEQWDDKTNTLKGPL